MNVENAFLRENIRSCRDTRELGEVPVAEGDTNCVQTVLLHGVEVRLGVEVVQVVFELPACVCFGAEAAEGEVVEHPGGLPPFGEVRQDPPLQDKQSGEVDPSNGLGTQPIRPGS